MSGGFFRGTSADQDTRFSNKQAKLLKTQKFAPELEHLVDTSKVEMDVMKPWIADRVTELLGFEDEVLINFIYGLLEAKEVNGKEVQIQLTGFMEKHTSRFMKELWGLLLSAQQNASGVPQRFLDAKEEETRKRKEESDRIVNEIQKRKEKEHKEHELVKSKKMDGGAGSDEDMEPNSKHLSRGSGRHSENRKGGSRNGVRRSRESRSPNSGSSTPPHRDASRSRSRSVSKSRSYSKEGKKSRSTSASPLAKNRSSSSPRMHQSPRKRSSSPRRRNSPGQSMSPRRRRGSVSRPGHPSPSPSRHRVRSPVRRSSPSPVSRSPSPNRGKRSHSLSRHRSPSPWRRRSPSPLRRLSRSPRRRLSRSPRRRRSPSPVRRHRRRSPFSPRYRRRSPIPVRRRPSSPARRRSPSPANRRSPSPWRRRYSPGERRYRSPAARRYRSPVHRRSPPRPRSPSPDRHRPPSPARHRSRYSSQRRSPSPIQSDSASPAREKSVSSLDHRSLSPVQHRSASSVRGRSPVSNRKKSLSPLQSRSQSPDDSISPAPIRRISSSPVRRRSTLQRSLVVPSKGRDSPHESPMKGDKRMTASGSKNPPPKSRDLKGRYESVGINEADEAEHVRDGQGSREIPSLINPVQSRLQEGRSDVREDSDLRKRDKGRRSKMMHHGEESRADGKRNLSKDVDDNILLDKDKPGNTLKLNNKDEREKPGSDGSAKHRGDISEKKKHKRSSRK
ncbi:Serine/arginine repetitive matrix protein 1-like protein, partial [Drosera capensis]